MDGVHVLRALEDDDDGGRAMGDYESFRTRGPGSCV